MAAVSLCAAISTSAQTADPGQYNPPGKTAIYGAGTFSCGNWLANRRGAEQFSYNAWLLGWVSAAGHYEAHGPLRDTDSSALIAWVDNYCREHPLDQIFDAAAGLVETLAKPE